MKKILFMQEVSGKYTSVLFDTDQQKKALRARKVSKAFEKQAPGDKFITVTASSKCKSKNRFSVCILKWPARGSQAELFLSSMLFTLLSMI